jgi:hypothetical protein
MKKEFILPKKWYIKVTEENKSVLNDFKLSVGLDSLHGTSYKFVSYAGYGYNSCPYGYTEITFEQFLNHINKQETMEKEIIGYTSPIKIEGENITIPIGGLFKKRQTSDKNYHYEHCFHYGLPKEIVETWKPVYKEEPEFKVGDWVYVNEKKLINGCKGCSTGVWKITNKIAPNGLVHKHDGINVCTSNDIWRINKDAARHATPEEIAKAQEVVFKAGTYVVITDFGKYMDFVDYFHVGGVYKLTQNFGTNYTDFSVEKDDTGLDNGYSSSSISYFSHPDYKIEIREATQKEIAEYEAKWKAKELYFGDVKFTIKKGDDFATTNFGKVTKAEIGNAISYIESPPRLAKYSLSIINEGKQLMLPDFDSDHIVPKLGFGCKSGKLLELKEIYKAFGNE